MAEPGVTFDHLKQRVEGSFPAHIEAHLPTEEIRYQEGARRLLAWSGKRLRPVTFLSTVYAIEGFELDKYVTLAGAIERLHLASLPIDDVMDESTTRKGNTALHADPEIGIGAALLAGTHTAIDGILEIAEETRTLNPGATDIIQQLRKYNHMIHDGQELDAYVKAGQADEEMHLVAIYKKNIIFEWATYVAACAVPGARRHLEACVEIGRCFSIGYQLLDDLLDKFGDADTLGKATQQDGYNSVDRWTEAGVYERMDALKASVNTNIALLPRGNESPLTEIRDMIFQRVDHD